MSIRDIKLSDSVHLRMQKGFCTHVTAYKEYVGYHSPRIFTEEEWQQVTDALKAEGFIEVPSVTSVSSCKNSGSGS